MLRRRVDYNKVEVSFPSVGLVFRARGSLYLDQVLSCVPWCLLLWVMASGPYPCSICSLHWVCTFHWGWYKMWNFLRTCGPKLESDLAPHPEFEASAKAAGSLKAPISFTLVHDSSQSFTVPTLSQSPRSLPRPNVWTPINQRIGYILPIYNSKHSHFTKEEWEDGKEIPF